MQAELIQLLKDKSISVLIIDPFIFTHRLLENDNAMQAELMNAWGFVASEAQAAIMIVHHSRKLNGEEATDDSIRGASSVLAAARSARVINPMTDNEAATLNITEEDRRNYFRIGNAKHNLARPAATAEWCKLVEVSLDNDPGRAGLPAGFRQTLSAAVPLSLLRSAMQPALQVARGFLPVALCSLCWPGIPGKAPQALRPCRANLWATGGAGSRTSPPRET